MLAGNAQKRTRRPMARAGDYVDSDSGEEEDEEVNTVESAKNWSRKDPGLVGTKIPVREKPMLAEGVAAALN